MHGLHPELQGLLFQQPEHAGRLRTEVLKYQAGLLVHLLSLFLRLFKRFITGQGTLVFWITEESVGNRS